VSLSHTLTRAAYRTFRATKQTFVARKPDALTRAFFRCLAVAERATSGRRFSERDQAERRVWKAQYFQRFGTEPLFRVASDHPVAVETADHKWPHGTLHDNSTNPRFNLKLYDYFGNRPDLALLDLGCSGGGFVRSVLADGFTAVGLEGSDVSQKLRSAEWDTCPHHLMTADIAAPFQVSTAGGTPVQFHCITAWEVLEHIPGDKLDALLDNIARHLAPDGIFVASVAVFPEANPITGAVYHVSIHPKPWWLERFAAAGLVEAAPHPFETADYVRGHGRGLTNWDPADGDGFHLVMRKRALSLFLSLE
jgi:2-polyprenyl-3-methyl-5-hydroxy-6-metoxy-1,4-benzoquinol methylase